MKYSSFILSFSIIVFLEFSPINCQVVVRQSDRAQIMYVNVVDDSNHLSRNTPKSVTYNFPSAFQNIPKAILSITTYYTKNNNFQAYCLAITSITTNSITLTVEGLGTDIYTLTVGILAVDYPNVGVFTGTINYNEGSKTHTVSKKILAFSSFFTSFNGSNCVKLAFNFDTNMIDNSNIKATASNFSCVSSVNYNLLLVYEDNANFPDLPFYQFNLQSSFSIFQGTFMTSQVTKDTTGPSTQLPSTDLAFYGLKDMTIGSFMEFGIFFTPQSGGLIQNGKYQVTCSRGSYYVYDANALIFEVNKLSCPSNQYMYNYSCITPYDGVFCTTNPNICFKCNTNCTKCQNSSSNCLACISASYLYQNACYDTIPPGTYCDSSNNCYPCSSTCLTCSGGMPNQCISCKPDTPYLYNGECITGNKDGVYCSNNSYTCQDCLISNCIACDSTLKSCLSCKSGFYRQFR